MIRPSDALRHTPQFASVFFSYSQAAEGIIMLVPWLFFIGFFFYIGDDFSYSGRYSGMIFIDNLLMVLTQLLLAMLDFIIFLTLWVLTYPDPDPDPQPPIPWVATTFLVRMQI
jgi:hypothetical protein